MLRWCALVSLLSACTVGAFSILDIQSGTTLGVGGGSDIYITGTDLGTPFSPPTVLIGNYPNPELTPCTVKGFTSSATRIHCVVEARRLPAAPASQWGFAHTQKLTLHLLVDGREAYCDNGDNNHIAGTGLGDCRLTFDVGDTPLITTVSTPAVSEGALIVLQVRLRTARFSRRPRFLESWPLRVLRPLCP